MKRTEAKNIGQIINEVLQKEHLDVALDEHRASALWPQIVGDGINRYTIRRYVKGIVLLQNKRNVLPIDVSRARRVLVVGENAIKMMTVGGGSSSLKVQHEILPLEGIKARRAGTGIEVDYARGYVGDTTGEYNGVVAKQSLAEDRSASELIAEAVAKAQGADYVIIFGGLNKSDYQDAEGHDRKQMDMPYGQDALAAVEMARTSRHLR